MDRKRYFAVADHGTNFDQRVPDEIYDYMVNDLGIAFGRQLGPVMWTAKSLKEDPNRPGYADLTPLKNKKAAEPSAQFRADFGENLDVAAHGNHNAYPAYMGKYQLDGAEYGGKPEWVPENIDAAVELAAAVFEYNYTDFDRPKYFEPLNEPHWKYFVDDHFAEWHMAVQAKFHEVHPDVMVGGMCKSVSYFYVNDYQSFEGIKGFYDATDGKMDFYSFHSYDYFKWEDGDFRGRVQSGLTLEGSLDLLQNYAVLQHGKEVPVVVSEQGGYVNVKPKGEYDGETAAAQIAAKYFPEDTWENKIKKHSIVSFVHVSSIIANTMAFMDHPHTVLKSVPFLLPNTWAWDPKYYAGLYVPENYTNKDVWVETHMMDFYKLFRDVDGRRIKVGSSDPDLQVRGFVDGSKVFLAINNQSWRPESVALGGIDSETVAIRRLGRNEDFSAYFKESTVATPKTLTVAGREAVLLIADFGKNIAETSTVNEITCYADKTRQVVKDATFKIKVPTNQEIDYATLRVGLTRPTDSSYEPIVTLNGKQIEVPLEDAADRFSREEYATTKLIPLNPADLLAENTVNISFPDGDAGKIGTAVIRVAVKQ